MIVEVGDVRLCLTADQAESLRRQLGVERPVAGEGLVDAAEIARRLGVSRDHVYAHADELGAVRVGTGPRPRLRFDPARIAARLGGSANPPEPERPRRRRAPRRKEGELLPVRGARP